MDLLARLDTAEQLPLANIAAASRTALLASTSAATIQPISATVDLVLHASRLGIPCAIASSAVRELVISGLAALNLEHCFEAVVARGDVLHGKPVPDLFLKAAHELGADPAQCLAVEDAPDGLTAARAAGMATLLVECGQLSWPRNRQASLPGAQLPTSDNAEVAE
jgi:beta-phosphoglucomutase-like phosphatase (HAD superfamily)